MNELRLLLLKHSKTLWLSTFGFLIFYNLYYFAISQESLFLSKVAINAVILASFYLQTRSNYEVNDFRTMIITIIPVLTPMILSNSGFSLISDKASLVLIVTGITLSSLSIIELWDSFAVLPSLRKIKSEGMYRIVRHPIYLGYFVSISGIFLNAVSYYNGALVLLFSVFTISRINLEETVLKRSKDYLNYINKVKYRVIPCIY